MGYIICYFVTYNISHLMTIRLASAVNGTVIFAEKVVD